jgi:hypothetical protein
MIACGGPEDATAPGFAEDSMPSFRAYTISKDRHVTVAPSVVIICENDQDGLQQAQQLAGEDEIELWDGPRFIARLKPSQGSKEPH